MNLRGVRTGRRGRRTIQRNRMDQHEQALKQAIETARQKARDWLDVDTFIGQSYLDQAHALEEDLKRLQNFLSIPPLP